jgi:hypothetical protein
MDFIYQRNICQIIHKYHQIVHKLFTNFRKKTNSQLRGVVPAPGGGNGGSDGTGARGARRGGPVPGRGGIQPTWGRRETTGLRSKGTGGLGCGGEGRPVLGGGGGVQAVRCRGAGAFLQGEPNRTPQSMAEFDPSA